MDYDDLSTERETPTEAAARQRKARAAKRANRKLSPSQAREIPCPICQQPVRRCSLAVHLGGAHGMHAFEAADLLRKNGLLY